MAHLSYSWAQIEGMFGQNLERSLQEMIEEEDETLKHWERADLRKKLKKLTNENQVEKKRAIGRRISSGKI